MTAKTENTLVSEILSCSQNYKNELIRIRRHIHANPELSFAETQTREFVSTELSKLNFQQRPCQQSTGLIAEIGEGTEFVAIRADLDALPIEETNRCSYTSANKGVMHACGHDAHTACLLGAAYILGQLNKKGQLPGKYRLIFQPAEEMVNSEGLSGASMLMKEGVLDNVQALLALHVHPGLPTGAFGFKEGAFLAACDSFNIKVKGKGGHGAYPETAVDAIVLSANLIQSLQTLISRRKSALSPAVLSIGGIKSNTFRPNIIAEEVELTGTVRYFDPEFSKLVQDELKSQGKLLEAMGGKMELDYKQENPILINDAGLSCRLKNLALELVGEQNVVDLPAELGAEDFAFYTTKVPSLFAILGAAIDGSPRELHSSSFDINEDALVYGAAFLAAGAIRLSQSSQGK